MSETFHLIHPSISSVVRNQEFSPLLIDAKLLAKLLSVGLRTVRAMDASGKLPQPLRIGGRVVWRLEEIRAWIDAGALLRAEWNARKASRSK